MPLVYKVDNPVQSSLLSSLVLPHTRLSFNPTLRALSHNSLCTAILKRLQVHLKTRIVKFTNDGLSPSLFYFSFLFSFCFTFLFLEQLGLGLISHAVTSVTTQWHSHKTDHKTWENLVEDSRTDNVIQHGYHMLASWTIHGCLG